MTGNNLKSGKRSSRRRWEDDQKKAEPRGEVAKGEIEIGAMAGHSLEDGEKKTGNQTVPPENWLKDPYKEAGKP